MRTEAHEGHPPIRLVDPIDADVLMEVVGVVTVACIDYAHGRMWELVLSEHAEQTDVSEALMLVPAGSNLLDCFPSDTWGGGVYPDNGKPIIIRQEHTIQFWCWKEDL